MSRKRLRVVVCRGPECGFFEADIRAALRAHIDAAAIGDRVVLGEQSCYGRCKSGPNMVIREVEGNGEKRFLFDALPSAGRSTMYNQLTPEKAVTDLDRHVRRIFGRAPKDP